jgi:hypothetical protein
MHLQKQRKKYYTKIEVIKTNNQKLCGFLSCFHSTTHSFFAPLSIYCPFFFHLFLCLSFSNHPNPTSPKQKQKKS